MFYEVVLRCWPNLSVLRVLFVPQVLKHRASRGIVALA